MSDSLAHRVHERIAGMLWRCWRTLGVPAQAEPVRRTLIDPETLIVLTAWIARTGETRTGEARMATAAADWCRDSHGMLPHARIRKLVASGDHELVGAVTALVALANGAEAGAVSALKFTTKPNVDAEPAVSIRINDPAMLRLRLRSLMGPSARAETLAVLLGAAGKSGGVTSAELAQQTLFGQRHLREALNHLVYGGWVSRWRAGAREYHYEVTEQSLQAFGPAPAWTDWITRSTALIALSRSVSAIESRSMDGVGTMMRYVTEAGQSLRSLGVSPPDWHEAGTPEGIARLESWIDDAVRRLTEVA